MEIKQSCRLRLSFKCVTIALNIFNILVALFLLQWFLSSRTKLSSIQPNSADFNYVKESQEMRLAMLPLELIKRVKEIQQEAYAEPKTVQSNDAKQTAAVDLSKRLKDFHFVNDAASLKVIRRTVKALRLKFINFAALEEWRKRKMERARQRELEKNGTVTSQA